MFNLPQTLELIFVIISFLCWGSFLNMLAYRLINLDKFWKLRSFCPKCNHVIYWYDNIPVISWIILKAKCRHCKDSISALYPFVEAFSAISFSMLYYQLKYSNDLIYFPAYFVFFSALIITLRTDLEFMLISQFVTIFLIPVGVFFSMLGLLPINLLNSLIGAGVGYFALFFISKMFYLITKKEGIGQGDLELLAFIGSFLGATGCWAALFIASILGSIFGLLYILITKQSKTAKMPFGHFLAIGAIIFVLFEQSMTKVIFGA